MSSPFIVAIDGPAGSGKGTLGRLLASHFGWKFLDTGLLYRAVANKFLRAKGQGSEQNVVEVAQGLVEEDLYSKNLRSPEITIESSKVASNNKVRQALIQWQRDFVKDCNGAVIDGRDIASVIFPDAPVKLYLTASAEERALRRHKELIEQGVQIPFEQVYEDLLLRDKRDSTRSSAPLVKTKDAVEIDTSNKTIEESLTEAIHVVEKKLLAP